MKERTMIIGRLMSFKGEKEYLPEENVLVEITGVEGDSVEVAFNLPIKDQPRIYLSVKMSELVREAMAGKDE